MNLWKWLVISEDEDKITYYYQQLGHIPQFRCVVLGDMTLRQEVIIKNRSYSPVLGPE